MTRQEIVNKVYLGLAAQGWKQSRGPSGGCMYRSNYEPGLKCAAGHLIPDEIKISPEMNGASADRDTMADVWNKLGLTEHVSFILELQRIHDTFPSLYMKDIFDRFVRRNSLEIPVLPEVACAS